MADITSTPLGSMSIVGGGLEGWCRVDEWFRVLARVRGELIVRSAALPSNSAPSVIPLLRRGLAGCFGRRPSGPFHHYAHDFLMQQAPGQCMGDGGEQGRGEVKPTGL